MGTKIKDSLSMTPTSFCDSGYERLNSIADPIADNEELVIKYESLTTQLSLTPKLKHWQWWVLVVINIFFLLAGQSLIVLLGRIYYDQGGSSKWLVMLLQSAGFPILYIPLLFLPSSKEPPPSTSRCPSFVTLASVYFVLGVILAIDNMLYSVGISYLSASTYSLICASQLAFNVVFSYFINSEKLTPFILNSVVVLSLSAALIAINDDSDGPSQFSESKYMIGYICTLGASAVYSLLLSLMQLTFQKVLKKESFSVVLELQIYTSLVATCICIMGLFASGDWRTLSSEMHSFDEGSFSYMMVIIWPAVFCQLTSVGVVGLIYLVSSLFSNVISTVALAITPIASVIVLHDKMNGVKVIAMLLAIWGFASYIYQNYHDDSKARKSQCDVTETLDDPLYPLYSVD